MPFFEKISEFIAFKTSCPFCQKQLFYKLQDFTLPMYPSGQKLSKISSPLTNDCFVFKLEYISAATFLNNVIKINTTSNVFNVQDDYATSTTEVIRIFEDMYPRVESYCSNKKCKSSYHIESSMLRLQNNEQITVRPIHPDWESWVISHYTVRSNFYDNSSLIWDRNTSNIDANPFHLDLLDPNANPDKILNKIQTSINFS